jgi:GTP pyrophosphokinase
MQPDQTNDSIATPVRQRAEAFLSSLGPDEAVVERARALARIVAALTDDEDILLGATLFPPMEARLIDEERARSVCGPVAARIAAELVRLEALGLTVWKPGAALAPNQAEALRKMLLAIVTDPRLVLVKLAAQLHKLRESKDAPPEERERIALETREIYAPLANRLGVWQLKWELEDWSFRYLDPENYKRVAGWLASKRTDRERYIEDVTGFIRNELEKAPAARSTSTASGERCSASISPSISSTTSAPSGSSSTASPTAMRPSAWCTVSGRTFRASSTTTSRRPRTICTAPCIPR